MGSRNATFDEDKALIARVLRQEPDAAKELLRKVADTIWTSCRIATRDEMSAREAFLETWETLTADSFVRLRSFTGQTRLEIFVAAVVHDHLARRVVRLLIEDADRGWEAFTCFFSATLKECLNLTRIEEREDIEQAVRLALLEDGCRLLKKFDGIGSFAGFVRRVVKRLVIDIGRKTRPRRQIPAQIKKLSLLDQAVFRAIYWNEAPADARILLMVLPSSQSSSEDVTSLQASIDRVRQKTPLDYIASPKEVALPPEAMDRDETSVGGDALRAITGAADELNQAISEGGLSSSIDDGRGADGRRDDALTVGSGEELLILREEQEATAQAIDALRAAMEALSETERRYLKFKLDGSTPQEIAALMALPVKGIYEMRVRVERHLRSALGGDPAVGRWLASIRRD